MRYHDYMNKRTNNKTALLSYGNNSEEKKVVFNTFYGQGFMCKTHKSFWGEKYKHCVHVPDGKKCEYEMLI